jgi:Flp pilus assembly protein TadD
MNRRSFGTALSTVAAAALLSGCASGEKSRSSIFGAKVDYQNIGLATKAQAALAEGQAAAAVALAEKAVANTPNDAGFRALLGNCYFAAGRFASAEAAYRDSLTLIPGQPEIVLKMALVQIAQGKNTEAAAVLNATRDMLDAANYGLALALAGRPDDAVAVLNQIARLPEADARVRQNLALAYGLSGDWTMARTVAAQDLPPDQLDGRIQQWMAMATPTRPSDQVAALTGVSPATDPGMPQQLALNPVQSRPGEPAQALASAEQPVPQPQTQFETQQAAAVPYAPPPVYREPEVAAAPPMPEVEAAPPVAEPDPVVAAAVQTLIEPAPVSAPPAVPSIAEANAPVAPLVQASAPVAPPLPTSFEAASEPPAFVAISESVRRAAQSARKPAGRSKSVVQLGAYSSPQRVSAAWEQLVRKYPALGSYTPMRARFDGPKGTVWRLSIKGFDSQREAIDRCELLQRRGGSCFVRSVAGDAPVQFASR